MRRGKGLVASPTTIVDDRFLVPQQQWDEGPVWWEVAPEPAAAMPWVWLGLGRAFQLTAAIVQADNNDSYRLSFRSVSTGAWESLWLVPPSYSFGVVTRPNLADDTERYILPQPVVTDALRFEAVEGDGMYSVSEIQVFGTPAQYPAVTPAPTAAPLAGAPPPRVAVDLGPVRICPRGSTPNARGRAAQERPPQAYTAPMAFDRRAGRIVLIAPADEARAAETWTFDVCTNTWKQMHPKLQPSGFGQLVFDVDSDVTIMIDESTRAWAYDLDEDTWTSKRVAPTGVYGRPRLAYDPATGLVVVDALLPAGQRSLWMYDVEPDAWMWIPAEGLPAEHQGLIALDTSVERLVSYAPYPGETHLVLIDPRTGAWSASTVTSPPVNFGWGPFGGEIAYDEATDETILFGDGRVIAYDAAADKWRMLYDDAPRAAGEMATGVTARLYHSMVYDAVNRRIVVLGGTQRTSDPDQMWVRSDDVIAFDPATRRWTTLLAASRVEPIGP